MSLFDKECQWSPGNTSLPTPSFHQDEGGDLSHVFSTGKATPGALYLVLGSPVEKRLGHIAESLMKRLRNDLDWSTSLLQGKAESLVPHRQDTGRKESNTMESSQSLEMCIGLMTEPLGATIWFCIKTPCSNWNGEMAVSLKGRHCQRFCFSVKFTYKPGLKICVRWRQGGIHSWEEKVRRRRWVLF